MPILLFTIRLWKKQPGPFLLSTIYCLLIIFFKAEGQNDFTVFNYTSKQGLPQNSVKSIRLDQNGFLWMTTEGGLVRFDGRNFHIFNIYNTKYLISNRLLELFETYNGQLLLTDTYGGLYKIEGNNISVVRKGNYGANDFLMIKGDLSSANFYINYLVGKRKKFLNENFHTPPLNIFPISEHDFLIRLKNGIAKYHDDKLLSSLDLSAYAPKRYLKISGHLYFFGENNRLYLLKYEERKVIPCFLSGDLLKDSLFRKSIINEEFWHNKDSVAHLRQGLSIYSLKADDQPTSVNSELVTDQLPTDCNINDIHYSKKYRTLFIGTDTKGLFVYKKKNFKTLNFNNPEPGTNNAYYSQFELDSNHIFSDWSRQFGLDGVYKSRLPINKNIFDNILKDRSGNVWFTKGDSLLKYEPATNKNKLICFKQHARATCFLEEGDSIWLMMTNGIAYLKYDSLHYLYQMNLQKTNDNAAGMYRSPDNKIWFCSCTGIFTYDTKTNSLDTLKPFYNHCVRNMTPVKGYLLVGTYGDGYFLYKNNRAVRMPLDRNNFLSQVHTFVIDSKGLVWMTTNQGIFKVPFDLLVTHFNDTTASVRYMYYNEDDGINNTEFNGGTTSSSLKLKNGFVSLTSMEGLVWFKPAEFNDIISDSPIIIDAVKMDDIKVDLSILEKVPSDVQSIKLDFATSYWGNSRNMLLQYKLDGYNKQWVDINPQQNQVEFYNLNSGKYKLQIRKWIGYDEKTIILKEMHINILPKFYEKSWFILLCLISAALFVVGVARLYAYRIKKGNKILEAKVQQRTSELNNANVQLHESVEVKDKLIGILSHDIVTPLRFIAMVARQGSDTSINIDKEDMRIVLEEIKNTSEKLHYNAQNILNWIKHQNKRISVNNTHVAVAAMVDEVTDLISELAISKGTGIVNNTGAEDIIKTDKNILNIILHNILTNAVKFTENGLITINAALSGHEYIITISDTGKGMKPEQLKKVGQTIEEKAIVSTHLSTGNANSNGLGYVIISELIDLINGKVYVDSVLNYGTTVRLVFPV